MMRDLDDLFLALEQSKFRRRQRLDAKDRAYLESKSLAVVLEHGRRFVRERLAAAKPKNDGRQTPMRGHPVFVAQHATGAWRRGCLAKWHYIAGAAPLSEEQIEYVLTVLKRWLEDALRETD